MQKVEYRGVVLDVIRNLGCTRTAMKDAAGNYLYHRWDVTIEANWQPALVSYRRGNAAGAPPVERAGEMPGETDLAVLAHLLQPRGLLKITAGDSVVLETPIVSGHGRMPCDCTGGPRCEMIGVPLMVGIRHWVVTLHFTADVRSLDTSKANHSDAIISNTYVSTEDIDFQRRSVRHVAGRAILRADVMRQHHVNANTFRDLYFDMCPFHYQRTNIQVSLSEDGTILTYSYDDVMQGYNRGRPSPIVSIECFRTGYVTCGSPGKIVMDTARSSLGALINSPAGIITAVPQLPSTVVSAGFAATLDNLPRAYMQCRCDLVGDRNADLGRLTSIALGVCVQQVWLGGVANLAPDGILLTAQLLTGTAELIFRQDIADQVYTSVELTIRWTDDAMIGVAALDLARGRFGNALQRVTSGAVGVIDKFTRDSKTVTVPNSNFFGGATQYLGNTNIVATRDLAFVDDAIPENPQMTQGAFGVNVNVPPPTGVVDGFPAGRVPAGIQKLIVMALLGQGQAPPPSPRGLAQES